MERLLVSLTPGQKAYLQDIRNRHGISMGAQIRSMVRDRMEGKSLYVETRPRTRPIWSKKTDTKFIPEINKELKAVFVKMREKAQSTTHD